MVAGAWTLTLVLRAGFLFIPNAKYSNNNTYLFVKNADLQSQLERFWLVEENCTHKGFSREQQECETEFSNNFTRDSTGRFEVTLPLRENYARLGKLTNATNRFYSLEKKFSKNETFKKKYVSFIDEYISLGHMAVISFVRSRAPESSSLGRVNDFMGSTRDLTHKRIVLMSAANRDLIYIAAPYPRSLASCS